MVPKWGQIQSAGECDRPGGETPAAVAFDDGVRGIGAGGGVGGTDAAGHIGRRLPWSLKVGASLVLGCWCLVLLLCPNARAQSYSIDWHTIDGGDGTSTGGIYSVSGTIGQHDAGTPMSGGQYSLTGGFWSLYAVQTPGAPWLRIFLTSSNTAAVAWPSPSTGYLLQQNTNNVSSVNWSNVIATIQDDGTTRTLIVNPPTGSRFYRLFKP